MWLLKPFYFIVIIIRLLFWLMKAFSTASHFCTVSFFNCWVNYVIYFVSCVFVYRSMCSINMVSEPRKTRHLSSSNLQPDHFFEKIAPASTAPEAENLPLNISQVRKLLIKLAWSTMLGVKEILKVHNVDLTLYVRLCDRLSAFSYSIRYKQPFLLTAFATADLFFLLHSKWLIQWSFSLHSTITSGRETWQ